MSYNGILKIVYSIWWYMFWFHRYITSLSSSTKALIGLASSESIASFIRNITYLYLPIWFSTLFNESVAGFAVWAWTAIICILLPLTGELANRYGALRVHKFSFLFFAIAGLTRYLFPAHPRSARATLLLMHIWYAFIMFQCYILRIAPKNQGGLLFGLIESVIAIWWLMATLLFPYIESAWYPIIPLLLIGWMWIAWLLTNQIHEDSPTPLVSRSCRNYFWFIKKWFHFVQVNKYYPLFDLSTRLFEGLFYGTIRFLFPLALMSDGWWLREWMSLGIYEILTIVLWGACGYRADKYGRKKANIIGRLCIIVWMICMVLSWTLVWFIWFGALVALGNNLIFWAWTHILEETNTDHPEDWSYIAFRKLILNLGWIIAAPLAWYIYSMTSLQWTLNIITWIITCIGITMIMRTVRSI